MPCGHPNCKARTMKGAEYCFFHNPAPEVVAKRNAARSKGGSTKGKVRTPHTIGEVKELVARALAEAVNGKKSEREIAGLAHLCQVALRTFELAELDSRLKKAGV